MNNNTPRIPDAIDSQKLAYMQLTAKLKESADKYGAGFVGGFVAPDGEVFMMTNMNEEDTNALLPDELKWMNWTQILLTCIVLLVQPNLVTRDME